MPLRTAILLIALGVLCCGPVALAAVPLTWNRSVEIVKQNNAELDAAEKNLRSAIDTASAGESSFYPQLSADLNYNRLNTHLAGIESDTTGYNADLTVSESLFNGFADLGRLQQARANAENVRATLQVTKARVSYNLSLAFASLRYAQESEKVADQITKRRDENMHLVELRYQSGNENKGSLLLSKAYLQQAKFEGVQARNLFQTTQTQFNQTLGVDPDQDSLITDERPLFDPGPSPDFKQLAVETPDHRQAVALEASSEAGITVARAAFYPNLSLNAGIGKQGPNFFPDGDHWSVGLGLTLPLFNGGHDYFATRAASATWGAATSNRLNTDRGLVVKLKQAYITYVESVERLKVDEAFLEAASLRAEVGRNKYNNGLLNFDQWDQIESDLIVRQKSALQSRRDRVLNEAAWEQAQGKGVVP